MQNSMIQNSFFNDCLGYSRHDCLQTLLAAGVDSIAFAHWLAIPSQQLLLVFRHQHCIAISDYQVAA